MTHRSPDPLDDLRAVDPVDEDQLPFASLARIRARVDEVLMTESTRRTDRGPILRRAGLGLAAAAAIALAVAIGGRGAPGGPPIDGNAMCVDPYTIEALADRDFAFDGTVTAITGSTVTFAVNQAFLGVASTTVTLDAPGMTGSTITSAGGPGLTVGGRYLVAGDDSFAWACGYTQAYDPGLAAEWSSALGD